MEGHKMVRKVNTYWGNWCLDDIVSLQNESKGISPDQNRDNKEFAEAKFKEVMGSYEAIKSERKNTKHL
ncbi:hypothetical protein Sango_2097200 [Sesamum angolense]|uniref:Uncharacterized protein n=1 Tax=Sesamum angolense TaxID=2727404 RepID=A0AAE1WBJ3_9LAMI|nr:hypothetical protein Sango_2097200 [Sesamum angolense]